MVPWEVQEGRLVLIFQSSEIPVDVVEIPGETVEVVTNIPGAGGSQSILVSGEVATYADLAGIPNKKVGGLYRVIADDLCYAWDGTSFPPEGSGLELTGQKGDTGDTGNGIETITISGNNLIFDMTSGPDISRTVPALTDASNAATAAAESATAAAGSATAASGSASTAVTKATEAADSATAAAGSESSASGSASTATSKATEATTAATNAGNSATAAAGSATAASNSATAASGSATTADTRASAAALSASYAETAVEFAADSATDAQSAATVATTKAGEASDSAAAAAQSAQDAENAASGVISVGGFTGVVTKAQLGINNVSNTSDADKPISTATQTAFDNVSSTFGAIVDGINADLDTKADLDNNGKLLQSQLPAMAVTDFLGNVVSQAAMLALTGERGDWCNRTDTGTEWQLIAEPASSLSSWSEKVYPLSPVSSVNGRTGAVTTSSADIVDATTVGRNVLKAADAAAARTAIGAGTSSLAIGTTGSTAAAGNDPRLTNTRTPTTGTSPYDITFSAISGVRAVGYGDVPIGITLRRAVTFTEMFACGETSDDSGSTGVQLHKNGSFVAGLTMNAGTGQMDGTSTTGSWSFAAGDSLNIYVASVGTTPGNGLVVDLKGTA